MLKIFRKNLISTFLNWIFQLESNPDAIAYNFLIGGDGLTYEGRGFNLQSGFNLPNRNVSLTVGIIGEIWYLIFIFFKINVPFVSTGDFTSQKPSKSQLDELEALIRESVLRGKLAPNFTIHGARNQSFLNDAEELFKVSSKRFDKWHSVIYLWTDLKLLSISVILAKEIDKKIILSFYNFIFRIKVNLKFINYKKSIRIFFY